MLLSLWSGFTVEAAWCTWDPTDDAAAITLSSGNLVASIGSPTLFASTDPGALDLSDPSNITLVQEILGGGMPG